MTSHTYDFNRKDLLPLLGWPLIPVACFAAAMHLGAAFHLLPKPRPTLDIDRTILLQKVEASRTRQDAQILLLGDSSCLMDAAARPLSQQLGRRALNLGTLSYLDLNAYASLLREYTAANPGRLRAVVLLLHPEALRRVAPEAYHLKLLQALLNGQDHVQLTNTRERLSHLLGLEIFRGRMLGRILPVSLPGAYGRYYGFSVDLENYLTEHDGTAVDPDPQPFKGNAEYRMAKQLESGSQAFRAAVPQGVKLLVGITPAPEGFVLPGHRETCERMLAQWSQWLQADAALQELPPTLPDRHFAKTTHLNEPGARLYTEILARSLEPHLR